MTLSVAGAVILLPFSTCAVNWGINRSIEAVMIISEMELEIGKRLKQLLQTYLVRNVLLSEWPGRA